MLPMVYLTGNAVSDPELRFTLSGKAVAKFRVASNNRVKGADGEWRDGEACFLDVTVWESKAETLVEQVSKGTAVMVAGRLSQRNWEDKEGNKRTNYDVTADEVAVVVKGVKSQRRAEADPWAAVPASNDSDEAPF